MARYIVKALYPDPKYLIIWKEVIGKPKILACQKLDNEQILASSFF
jgi:hypothetical protein